MSLFTRIKNGFALTGICIGMVACANPTEEEKFAAMLNSRGSDGTPIIWHQNRSQSILSLESRGYIGGKDQRISGTFTFSPGGNGATPILAIRYGVTRHLLMPIRSG